MNCRTSTSTVESTAELENASAEGVAGTTTHAQGSVWFQVSGVENDADKSGVEAVVLKKLTKDLSLHPIQVSLKWDHLSDLKLADFDSELRHTLTCCWG